MISNESTKGKIINAAIKLLPELGYEKTSMRKIAEAVGITKPAVYYHFTNKEDLFKAIVDYGNQYSIRQLEKIKAADAPIRDKLFDMMWLKFHFLQQDEAVEKFSGWMMTDGIRYITKFDFDKDINEQLKIVFQILDEAKEKGELRSDLNNRSFLFLLIGAINIFARRKFVLKEEVDREILEETLDTLLRDARTN